MWDRGGWARKNTRSLKAPKTASNRNGYDIVDEIAPGAKDLVIYKQKPSGFFGTPMTGYLTQLQCDSVIVTGRTTSGCVRATVRRRLQLQLPRRHGGGGLLRPQPGEPRDDALRLGAKYADIVKTEEVLSYFDTLPTGHVRPAERRPGVASRFDWKERSMKGFKEPTLEERPRAGCKSQAGPDSKRRAQSRRRTIRSLRNARRPARRRARLAMHVRLIARRSERPRRSEERLPRPKKKRQSEGA